MCTHCYYTAHLRCATCSYICISTFECDVRFAIVHITQYAHTHQHTCTQNTHAIIWPWDLIVNASVKYSYICIHSTHVCILTQAGKKHTRGTIFITCWFRIRLDFCGKTEFEKCSLIVAIETINCENAS